MEIKNAERFVCVINEFSPPFAHFFALPALHALFLHTQALVGNNQILINSDNFPETLAFGAGADGTIKTEHQVCWFFKQNAIGFKSV